MMTNNCGIYKIANTITGDFYIGSSCNIGRRLYEHRLKLVNNRHINPHLQNSWNKYGVDNFEFTTILLCDKSMTLYCEQELLDLLKPEYNIALSATAPMRGLRSSEETKLKISGENHHNFGKHHSAETRALMSAACAGENNPNFGKHPSAATLALMSAASQGRPNGCLGYTHTDAARANMSEAQKGNTKALGYKHTDAARANMSASRIGNANSLGYEHTEETRAKMRAAQKRRWAKKELLLEAIS